MKFLLAAVNAKYIHSNPAVYSLRAFAGEYREHIEIAEYTINQRKEQVLADLYKRKPDVAAFSCYIWNWEMIQDLITELAKIMPELPIWLGGPEVSYGAEAVLQQFPTLAGIMIGEGEETFLDLIKYYRKENMPLSAVKGILTKEGRTEERPLLEMSRLPFLYENLEEFENKIIYYESGRGCPFRCSYCLSSIDKQVRFRDLAIVKKELLFFLEQRTSQVKFVDRTFNCNHEHAMEIWRFLKENDNGVTNFHFEISADILNEEEIELLQSLRPGLAQLEIGVQSTNPETLREINRFVKFEDLKQTVERIQEGKNIHLHLDLIAGLPFEDFFCFAKSFNDVYALRPEQLQLGFLKVLKGSAMHEKTAEYGINYTDKPPYEVLYSRWLSYGEVLQLKAVEEMLEVYYNSGQFITILPVLENLYETAFSFYEALAEFHERRGYLVNHPARAYRYEVLLQFALEKDSGKKEFYQECLIYDMYLRENLKSRPDFAGEEAPYKEAVRSFYEGEAAHPLHLKDYQEYNARQMSKMTHMEAFCYRVWETDRDKIGEKLLEPQFILFDYKRRNPLTYQAATVLLKMENGKGKSNDKAHESHPRVIG